jgi:hypothetical protein
MTHPSEVDSLYELAAEAKVIAEALFAVHFRKRVVLRESGSIVYLSEGSLT